MVLFTIVNQINEFHDNEYWTLANKTYGFWVCGFVELWKNETNQLEHIKTAWMEEKHFPVIECGRKNVTKRYQATHKKEMLTA